MSGDGTHGYPAGWCIHYRSPAESDTCQAGVNYAELNGGTTDGMLQHLPCFMPKSGQTLARVKCDKCRPPTQDEIATHNAFVREHAGYVIRVLASIDEWRRDHKRQSATMYLDCPACQGKNGRILVVLLPGGHTSGKCSTPGCLTWIE